MSTDAPALPDSIDDQEPLVPAKLSESPGDSTRTTRDAWRERLLFLFWALTSIGCASAALSGLEKGWAKFSKNGIMHKTSPYTNLLDFLYREKGHPIPRDQIEFIDRNLPKTPVDVTVNAHVPGGEDVSEDFYFIAIYSSPTAEIRKHVKNLIITRKDTLVLPYTGDRRSGYYMGIITIVGLTLSVGVVTIGAIALKIAKKKLPNHLKIVYGIAICLILVYLAEILTLMIGGRRDLGKNPVVQHEYTPRPDWAWICAVISAFCLLPLGHLA